MVAEVGPKPALLHTLRADRPLGLIVIVDVKEQRRKGKTTPNSQIQKLARKNGRTMYTTLVQGRLCAGDAFYHTLSKLSAHVATSSSTASDASGTSQPDIALHHLVAEPASRLSAIVQMNPIEQRKEIFQAIGTKAYWTSCTGIQ